MSNGSKLNRAAARSKDVPVSPKEKVSTLVNGLTGIVNAIHQNPDKITPQVVAGMAEHLLGLVGFQLKKREEIKDEKISQS